MKRESPPGTLFYETRRAHACGPSADKLTILENVAAAVMLAIVAGLIAIAALFALGS